jgi:hypothetical protein
MFTLENAIQEVQENREEMMPMGHTSFCFTLILLTYWVKAQNTKENTEALVFVSSSYIRDRSEHYVDINVNVLPSEGEQYDDIKVISGTIKTHALENNKSDQS